MENTFSIRENVGESFQDELEICWDYDSVSQPVLHDFQIKDNEVCFKTQKTTRCSSRIEKSLKLLRLSFFRAVKSNRCAGAP